MHILINHGDQLESLSVEWRSSHWTLPLHRSDSFHDIAKEVLFPYYSGYNIIFIGFYLPGTGLLGICLTMHSAFLHSRGQSSAL